MKNMVLSNHYLFSGYAAYKKQAFDPCVDLLLRTGFLSKEKKNFDQESK
jgi:hypothetical protein